MTDQHIIALRRALVRSESENADLRHQLMEALNDRDAAKDLLIAATEPREELVWPAGCLSVLNCRLMKECSGGCFTHSGRDIKAAAEEFTRETLARYEARRA
jgi:hypothetical protein